ncbi:Alpha/beta knot methyltransferase [Penicillium capsulatum]|uniref:rRNA methyltransferase 1, mitochondrial n=1 Tax=Penicillium capsulatum TaxID=69766 RepID=A0A9W9LR80_9EURO|nr:Alpha/beta knot methyltransferase [Penicillium capsulatum]KAJ6135374.1 Alpha/beta knot methyltransferase [Penicillium capsulatum]
MTEDLETKMMRSSLSSMGLRGPMLLHLRPFSCVAVRQASLNSAISRGIRRSLPARIPRGAAGAIDDHRRPQREERQSQWRTDGRSSPNSGATEHATGRGIRRSPPPWARTAGKAPNLSNDAQGPRRDDRPARPVVDDRKWEAKRNRGGFDEDEFIRTGNFRGLPREHRNHGQSKLKQANYAETPRMPRKKPLSARTPHHRPTDAVPARVKENVKVPDSIPYTTPASEFIYGTSPVLSALRCSRRQIYKLYIYQPFSKPELGPNQITLRKLALSKNIEVKLVSAGWDRLLDKMSSGWPHQNCVLEVSPLPKLPVMCFKAYSDRTEDRFRVELAPQSREEAMVNGTNDLVEMHRGHRPGNRRYPVALLVDGIVDPGNLGAILRSAYFLGIDAVVFAGRNAAPLSPVTIKASCGAAENMAILHVRNEVDFIKRSKENGWRFYAADAPGAGVTYLDQLPPEGNSSSHGRLAEQSPCVLMMGSEATGLSAHIKSHADAIVSIPGARHSLELGVESDPARVDSLNVSVAAALLMHTFMQVPLAVSGRAKAQDKMW